MNFCGFEIKDIPQSGSYIPIKVYSLEEKTFNLKTGTKAIVPTDMKVSNGIAHIDGLGTVFAAAAVAPAPQVQGHVWKDISNLPLVEYTGRGQVKQYLESKGNPSELDVRYNVLPLFTTQARPNLEGMFCDCKSLKEIDVSYIDFTQIKGLNEMFYDCENLEYVNFGNADTSKVETFAAIFGLCPNLKQVDGVLDVAGVKMDTGRGSADFPFFSSAQVTGLQFKNVPKDLDMTQLGLQPYQYTILSYRD